MGIILALCAQSRSSHAVTRVVPDQYPTIQNAITASAANDTVLVRPGTYPEKVDYLGKAVVLRSSSGPAVTTIDATGQGGSAVYMSGLGIGASLEGFTIRKGTGTTEGAFLFAGGGVHVREGVGAGPRVENNWITENSGSYGGGVFVSGGARILNNRIFSNQAVFNGGGVLTGGIEGNFSNVVISQNEIFGNRSITGGTDFHGGGVYLAGFYHVILTRNIIACNEAAGGGGGYVNGSPSGVVMEGNTFFANWGREGVGGIHFSIAPGTPAIDLRRNAIVFNLVGGVRCSSELVDFECNDIHGNNPDLLPGGCENPIGTNGNVSVDPLFGAIAGCPPAPGDLCLDAQSPLLPEHSPPGCDLIGARGLCSAIGIADETPAPAEQGRVSAQPNPFATRTTLKIDLVGAAEIDLRIVNAMGRLVAKQNLGTLHAGRHEWTWDGRDEVGRKAPEGIYYVDVTAGTRTLVTRLMILR